MEEKPKKKRKLTQPYPDDPMARFKYEQSPVVIALRRFIKQDPVTLQGWHTPMQLAVLLEPYAEEDYIMAPASLTRHLFHLQNLFHEEFGFVWRWDGPQRWFCFPKEGKPPEEMPKPRIAADIRFDVIEAAKAGKFPLFRWLTASQVLDYMGWDRKQPPRSASAFTLVMKSYQHEMKVEAGMLMELRYVPKTGQLIYGFRFE